jgi:DNA-binding response OmpR family regulator
VTTILIADNDRSIRQYCKEELEHEGFRVVLAQDGVEALKRLVENSIDVVILDAHMPRSSGLETAKRMRQLNPLLPIILFTDDRGFDRHNSPQVDATVIKDADFGELKAIIDRVISPATSRAVSVAVPTNAIVRPLTPGQSAPPQ